MAVAADFHRDFLIPGQKLPDSKCKSAFNDLRLFFCLCPHYNITAGVLQCVCENIWDYLFIYWQRCGTMTVNFPQK